jgi:hypothetical protein
MRSLNFGQRVLVAGFDKFSGKISVRFWRFFGDGEAETFPFEPREAEPTMGEVESLDVGLPGRAEPPLL